MKRHLVFLALGGLLLMLVALPTSTSAAPTGACYLTPTGVTLAAALASPYCVNINLAKGTYYAHGLTFARDVVITGAGSKKTTIDARASYDRIFSFTGAGATFVLSGVTLKNGKPGGNGGARRRPGDFRRQCHNRCEHLRRQHRTRLRRTRLAE